MEKNRYVLKYNNYDMTAYAKTQFMQMTNVERESIVKGLLKYCELDTLAMVMLWESWYSTINN